jgi:hypothetical protein
MTLESMENNNLPYNIIGTALLIVIEILASSCEMNIKSLFTRKKYIEITQEVYQQTKTKKGTKRGIWQYKFVAIPLENHHDNP